MQLAPTEILLMVSLLLSSQSVVGVTFFKVTFQLVPLFASSLAGRSLSFQLNATRHSGAIEANILRKLTSITE